MSEAGREIINQAELIPARYSEVALQKASGATYTPLLLADFVARQMVQAFDFPADWANFAGPLRLLDPAVGDGALLASLLAHLPPPALQHVLVTGFDTDPVAIDNARLRLQQQFPALSFQLEVRDFLDYALQMEAAPVASAGAQARFDLVIANPPYVRTQIMGAQAAQALAKNFGLSGRIDLYFPFLLGISSMLSARGVAGVITSNRFMTTRSGQAVRRELLTRFHLLHVWDLGDSKLFAAAVLPSVLLARSAQGRARQVPPVEGATAAIGFSSLYAAPKADARASAPDALAALAWPDNSVVKIDDGRRFQVCHGRLDNGGAPDGVWRIGTLHGDAWLATVRSHAWGNFARIGKIRVGVKSTADKVFIRHDWDTLPGGKPELLRPLITRYCARRFKGMQPAKASQRKQILYPHQSTAQGRSAVDLALYPQAQHYLRQHRAALESRAYLIAAGRNWYELWVPQDPAAWSAPKLIFADISEQPVFWLDDSGSIVNGECYWLRCEGEAQPDWLWLAMAVANSSFIEVFYDKCFNNKLYAGRRRFMAQYVEQFPLPDPASGAAQELIALARQIHAATPSPQAEQLARELDAKVWQIFGLPAPL